VPYPADYGGVFDLFYKLKTLHQLGIKIHLHCFEYGRGEQPQLNEYCEEVHYYHRNKGWYFFDLWLPYIVTSRINLRLIKNLLKDNYPILLEGIHCTYYLFHGELNHRKMLVRLHNVEYEYYHQLAKSENTFYKKIYFTLESYRLKRYENILAKKASLIAVNEKDQLTYQKKLGANDIKFLPVFLPFNEITSQSGKGDFCLYHGNLSVAENEKAAMWLLENVAHKIPMKLIVAGKNPSNTFSKSAASFPNVQVISNPSQYQMNELIRNAHIHLLPSFNNTGIKIKLLHALFNGRFIICNKNSTDGTGLENLCVIAENAKEYFQKIKELNQLPFTENEIQKRQMILKEKYNNEKNARQLIEWL
jgi:hypothetical protein